MGINSAQMAELLSREQDALKSRDDRIRALEAGLKDVLATPTLHLTFSCANGLEHNPECVRCIAIKALLAAGQEGA